MGPLSGGGRLAAGNLIFTRRAIWVQCWVGLVEPAVLAARVGLAVPEEQAVPQGRVAQEARVDPFSAPWGMRSRIR